MAGHEPKPSQPLFFLHSTSADHVPAQAARLRSNEIEIKIEINIKSK